MSKIIESIFREKPVFEHELFHIVHDADPICKNHLLVFPNKCVKSFLECGTSELNELFLFLKSVLKEDYCFFEKGNVSFCTSFNEKSHAHLHLIPKGSLNSNSISMLVKTLNAKDYINIQTASNANSNLKNNIYLMFGVVSESLFIKEPFDNMPKRFIRNYVANSLIL